MSRHGRRRWRVVRRSGAGVARDFWMVVFALLFGAGGLGAVRGEDWPTYQHDPRRSGVTEDTLHLPLGEAWVYRSPVPPMMAWSGPAKWDAYVENEGLQSMRNFDPAFYVTAAGEAVYFGSSVDDAAHCLDAVTGEERWVFFTGSAVRLPPTVQDGKAWFGSDDGFAYCVSAERGELLWKLKPSPDPRRIPNNGKLISLWPVRSGVLVKDGRAYFAASLLPWEPSYLCAVEAGSGSAVYLREETGVTLQGAMLASSDSLYAPQGRSVPLVYARATGERLGGIEGSGGVYCVLTEDEQFIAMPSSQKEKEDTVRIADGRKRQVLVSFGGANRMIVSGKMAFSHQGKQLKAIDRFQLIAIQAEIDGLRAANERRAKEKKALGANQESVAALDREIERANREVEALEASKVSCEKWSVAHPLPLGFMLAGEILLTGGDGVVSAVDASDGKLLWSAAVEGIAYGLAAAGGRLYVSTDRGRIHCFHSS